MAENENTTNEAARENTVPTSENKPSGPEKRSTDFGSRDSGSRDSGSRDSGSRDSGSRDSGSRDSGSRDSGSRDSGGRDRRPDRRRDGKRRYFRKKVCFFCSKKVPGVNYKELDLLRRFVTDRGKMLPRRITGTCARHQRIVARAVKRARIVALLPFEDK